MPGYDLGNRVFKYDSNTGDATDFLSVKVVCRVLLWYKMDFLS